MKIVVCGAGRIGKNIVSYLSQGNNDISVIDNDQRHLDEIAKEWDVLPVLGSASHPEILEKAGAMNADLILAVTNVDEVNMIACQVADYLFHVRKKIARIDSKDFMDPLWCELYNEKNIPLDLMISPDIEIAKAIYSIIKIPGTSSVMPLYDNKIFLLSIRCQENCPLFKVPLNHIEMVAPELRISLVSIVRQGKNFIPGPDFMLEEGDEVYFLVEEKQIDDAVHTFGMDKPSNEKVVIFGGNLISQFLAKKLGKDDSISSCKIIDEDSTSAKHLARILDNTTIIYGEMMSDIILDEAGVNTADVTVSATLRDKDNLLASLISRKNGARSTISLVNSRAYSTLVSNFSDSIVVDSSSVTVSAILKELRKAKIRQAYSLGRGFGEVWEIKIDENSPIIDKKIIELEIPDNSKVCAICRGEIIIYPTLYDKIYEGDNVILFSSSKAIRKVEKIFSR